MSTLSSLFRSQSTTRSGLSFSSYTVQAVWDGAAIVPGADPALLRKDANGAWIERVRYGDTSHPTNRGWEIDHIKPVSKGGTDDLGNLQPLQWRNNRAKGDDYPNYNYAVTATD